MMHKEDIKAALRKTHNTLVAFEIVKGLPPNSVKDVLRGRASAKTEKAIAKALNLPLHELFPRRYPDPKGVEPSTKRDNSTPSRPVHRLSRTAA